jgi:hypothetical protein
MTAFSELHRRLAKLEDQQLAAKRRLAAEREFNDPTRHYWMHPGPDGKLHKMQWTPQMGPWEVLLTLIDAAESAGYGEPYYRRADGSLATLPQLMAEIEKLMSRAASDPTKEPEC